jgi:hypothetical protein
MLGGGVITGGATWLGAGTACANAATGSNATTIAARDVAKTERATTPLTPDTMPERVRCPSPADRRIGGVERFAIPITPRDLTPINS